MADAFKSPHIQETLPDLIDLAKKARAVCNERNLAFVIIVYDAVELDSWISSNLSQGHAISLIKLATGTGHGEPKTIT